MTQAQELASVGVTSSTAFCGTKKITLGIQDGFGINAWSQASMAAVRSEAAKCPNVSTVVQIGGGSLQTSISQINSMVAQGINALVAIPDFGQSELPALRAATKAGVKVVPWGADPGGTDGVDYVSYVDWSSPSAGTLWAQWMVKALHGKGKIVFIGGPAGNPVTTGQLNSVVKVVQANPGITLLTGDSSWPVTNWDPATAQKVMSALLAKYPTIDGVISDYGTDALAATVAFQAAGRKLVPIATLDANGLGCLYSKNKTSQPGFQLATISSRNWLGRIAARKAIAAAEGVADNEPSIYDLPIIEDSLNGPAPVCLSSAPDDFYDSNNISQADLAKYGKP
ncbi:MAG: substrate-binding domain-containing protein [Actinobacteria bacterium]|nr:substrate-binding domain-containing protein [Actinomycetota bacterium]